MYIFNLQQQQDSEQVQIEANETSENAQKALEVYLNQVFRQLNLNPLTIIEELELLHRNLNSC